MQKCNVITLRSLSAIGDKPMTLPSTMVEIPATAEKVWRAIHAAEG